MPPCIIILYLFSYVIAEVLDLNFYCDGCPSADKLGDTFYEDLWLVICNVL